MFSFLVDIVVGIFDFIVDVLLFRSQRERRGSRRRSVAEDSLAVAHFDFVTLLVIFLVSAELMLLLALAFDVPVGWSIAIGLAVGVVWALWRYARLLREP